MSRYIDADALVGKLPDGLPYKGSVKRVLMQAHAADVVEVVRCKDCVFWNTDKKGFSDECVCRRFSELNVCDNYTLPTDFCSYGERREK